MRVFLTLFGDANFGNLVLTFLFICLFLFFDRWFFFDFLGDFRVRARFFFFFVLFVIFFLVLLLLIFVLRLLFGLITIVTLLNFPFFKFDLQFVGRVLLTAFNHPRNVKIIQQCNSEASLCCKLTVSETQNFLQSTFLVNQLAIDARNCVHLNVNYFLRAFLIPSK